MRLDRLAMRHQRVRRAVALHRADGLEVDAEQLAETAALLQPAMRRALGCRLGQASDDDAGEVEAAVSTAQRRVMTAIEQCRTAATRGGLSGPGRPAVASLMLTTQARDAAGATVPTGTRTVWRRTAYVWSAAEDG